MTHLIDVIVEELESPDSEDGLDSDEVPYRHYTLVMKSLKQPASTYLLIDSKEEKVHLNLLTCQPFYLVTMATQCDTKSCISVNMVPIWSLLRDSKHTK